MTTNNQDWLKLANAVFSAKLAPTEALLVHGWGDLHDQTIDFVGNLYQQFKPKLIALNGAPEYELGTPGVDYWRERLITKWQVPAEIIKATSPAPHTLAEAEGFITLAVEAGVKTATVISVPAHILRAFLTNLGVVQNRGLDLKLTPLTYVDVNWTEPLTIRGLVGVHAEEETTRLGRLVGECGRIVEYRAEFEAGNKNYLIASIEDGLDHLGLSR
ncbi:MAG: hypothetical protein Q7T49_02500 [bacterium]|nr:hypothetical protein [bacterium]